MLGAHGGGGGAAGLPGTSPYCFVVCTVTVHTCEWVEAQRIYTLMALSVIACHSDTDKLGLAQQSSQLPPECHDSKSLTRRDATLDTVKEWLK